MNKENFEEAYTYTIEVNLRNIRNKNAFFKLMKDKFYLPYYYHNNLDSLDECMRDLSWIYERNIQIKFKNVSNIQAENYNLYNSIFRSITFYKEYWDQELLNPESKHVSIEIL